MVIFNWVMRTFPFFPRICFDDARQGPVTREGTIFLDDDKVARLEFGLRIPPFVHLCQLQHYSIEVEVMMVVSG